MQRWTPHLRVLRVYGAEERLLLRPLLAEAFGDRDYNAQVFDRPDFCVAYVVPYRGKKGYAAHAALFIDEDRNARVEAVCVDPGVARTGLGSLVLQACLVHHAMCPDPAPMVTAHGLPKFLKANGFRNFAG